MTTAAVPGLDTAALLAHRSPRHDLEQIRQRIRRHLDDHDGYVAFSGGKDSLVCLHLTLQVEPNAPVVFFDGGLEYPETYTYLRTVEDHFSITIERITSAPILEALAASQAWTHDTSPLPPTEADLHEIHIVEPARRAHEQYGPGELWGVRSAESRGRRALYATALRQELARACGPDRCSQPDPRATECRAAHGGLVRRSDGTAAYGPIWDWTTPEVWAHIHRHQLPVNPVYAKLRRLGAPDHALRVGVMVDGGQLHTGRLVWLQQGWPTLFNDLAQVLPRMREFV